MKKLAPILLAVALVIGLTVPIAIPAAASPATMTVVSDTNTMVTEINNVDVPDQNAVLCWVPPGWWSGLTWSGWVGAQWIWDTYRSDDPIQSTSASITGRVVRFERTFDISGTPTAGTLHIAVDNGYEVWLNGQFVGTDNVWPLPPGDLSWRTSNLKQEHVDWTNWQTVGNYNVSSLLQSGTNILVIIACNEYMYTDDTMPSGTAWPRTGGPYEPVGNKDNNPAGVVFQLDIEYEEPLIEVEKDYRYTNVCFERDNDLDGLIDEDPVDCPLGTYLGDLLPMDDGNYILEAVIHPKNNKVLSYNPGQYYAVSTVEALTDVDTLTIMEDWSDCCEISTLNPPTGGGCVVIVQVGGEIDGVPVPDPSAAYQIMDATSDAIVVDTTACIATATLENVVAGTTIYMYVKFGPGLKGQTWAGPYTCTNYNGASVVEEPTYPDDYIIADATLILVEKD